MGFNSFRSCRRRVPLVCISAALLMSLAGGANAADITQIVHARKAHFKTLGRNDKFLRDEMHRSHPDWHWIGVYAKQIAALSNALPTWFPAGSGKGHGVATQASREIWEKPTAFARAAQRMKISADNLTRDAAKHDLNALAFNARKLGQSCDSCHRVFRTRSSWW
ncbi:hypothetical protein BI364_02305 [Acidihalobacter yilgarnensis]|uniref:Cytochrome c n=1 Tax=Acidihalobacter yilgarnensis TaxID=2819280 RepID=A0A1D8IKL3_9GAMM|nr:cytochrome c [Acidihalobacter yilgarnensis]AOU96994.1 hypothetical protein BI364_02305 [Acidihalobacter yilgarnensis]